LKFFHWVGAYLKSGRFRWGSAILWITLSLAACTTAQDSPSRVVVQVSAAGQTIQVTLPVGSTAQEALDAAGMSVNVQDRVEPPPYEVLLDGGQVRVIRVEEKLDQFEEIVPFEQLEVRSESLPEGEKLLSQRGVNGLQVTTIRHVYEDGVEVASDRLPPEIVKEPVPEIVVVGAQQVFTPMPIPGKLAYLLGGNAWVMESTTGRRRPVVKSGDLDGRIFSLSPDGKWLLFSRRSENEGEINTLWLASVSDGSSVEIDLKASNIVHFADWSPNSLRLTYSTVEPRAAAPGWQANNDLHLIALSSSGFLSQPNVELETNSGGVYGWWGTMFAWAPDSERLAYASPDSVGTFKLGEDGFERLLSITPLKTGSDWAWVPGVGWGPDGNILYTVEHVPQPGGASPEESPLFDLVAISLAGGVPVRLAPQVGMFAYPQPSPFQVEPTGERGYQVAFLQAVFPTQSETSSYRLAVMDRDGSDRRLLFPAEGVTGLKPQQVVWSPARVQAAEGYCILVIYQGNIWIVSAIDGRAWQITGDGLAGRISWR
jgi:Tol biopolymer transport system component